MSLNKCPVFGAILMEIECATEFGTLSLIESRTIPHTKGISDEQRTALLAAITEKENELCRNANIK